MQTMPNEAMKLERSPFLRAPAVPGERTDERTGYVTYP